MRSSHYILAGILDYKESVELAGVQIQIEKKYENNLRERNPQLGIVRCVPPDNPLKLNLGDIIAVNHFSFYGDIDKDKNYQIKDHVNYEGEKLFIVDPRNMYFKYNDKTPEPLDGILVCEGMQSPEEENGIWRPSFTYKDRCLVTSGSEAFPNGTVVLVKQYCMYAVPLDKKEYYRVRETDVVAVIVDGEIIPTKGNMIIEDLEEEKHEFLDLSMVGKKAQVDSVIVKSAIRDFKDGKRIRAYRSTGVKYKNQRVVNADDDHIVGIYAD